MTRTAIYARFSTQMQREASIEDQVRVCEDRARRDGLDVVAVHSDMAISGSTLLRPGLQAVLECAARGEIDLVLAEALDRLSRDQADIAALYKTLSFRGVRILTLAEGEISELHVGLKGTMNQLFLKDLAAKTRRGLRGRVEAGKSGGGNSYGYDVVRRLGPDGELVTGERTINEDHAAIIRRIFREFADGLSPKLIARRLNAESIPGPRGMAWRDTAIRGHRARGSGLINNELYVGRLVWNRLRYVKDPGTGRRISRQNPPEDWITTDVPALRIIDEDLWQRVKVRQGEITASPRVQAIKATRFWEKKRSIHLLTGLLRCGSCGSGFAAVGKDYLACSAARKLGTCDQTRGYRRVELEEVVLTLLRERLMQPDAVARFITNYGMAVNAGRAQESASRGRLEQERTELVRRLNGLYDAIADGIRTPGLKDRLEELEARRADLDAELAAPPPTSVRLHPNLSAMYRRKVEQLSQTLSDPEIRPMAIEAIRSLIQSATIESNGGNARITLDGAITALIGLAQPEAGQKLSVGSVEVVAGTGFEPVTFRL